MSAATERSLFAAKGRATAAGIPLPAGARSDDPADAASPALPRETPAQAPLPLADTPTIAAAKPAAEQPAGSLLSFRLRNLPGRSALTAEIVTALEAPRSDIEAAPAGATSDVPFAAPSKSGTETALEGPETTPAPGETLDLAAAALSHVSDRLDRPLFPDAAPRTAAAPLDRAETPLPPFAHAAPSSSTAKTVLPAAIAVLAIAVVGWLIAHSSPGDAPSPIGAATPSDASAPAGATEETAGPVPSDAATTPAEPAPTPLPPVELPAATDRAADATAVATAEAPAVIPAAGPNVAVAAAPVLDTPTLDVVRAEPGAPPVLAGRAAPGSELIILDNGEPIGTATADNNGEWAMVGSAPLSAGRHELSLALKTPEGSVVVEQAETETAPPGALAGLPVPAEKPAQGHAGPEAPAPTAAGRLYVVQLASVPSAADAEREWSRLQKAYPALLGTREATIDAAEVGGRGTFYRIRTGPFDGRDDARALCRELNGAGQECLVVREASAAD